MNNDHQKVQLNAALFNAEERHFNPNTETGVGLFAAATSQPIPNMSPEEREERALAFANLTFDELQALYPDQDVSALQAVQVEIKSRHEKQKRDQAAFDALPRNQRRVITKRLKKQSKR